MGKTASIFQALNESKNLEKKPVDVEGVLEEEEKYSEEELFKKFKEFLKEKGLEDVSEESELEEEEDWDEDWDEEEEEDVSEESELEEEEDWDEDWDEEVEINLDSDEELEEDEDEEDVIEISEYNEDTVKALKSILISAKAPKAIRKAYEGKLYERCLFWLDKKKGITIDLTEGFTKKESRKISSYLKRIKAPKAILEAVDRGQHSLVAAYLKTRK